MRPARARRRRGARVVRAAPRRGCWGAVVSLVLVAVPVASAQPCAMTGSPRASADVPVPLLLRLQPAEVEAVDASVLVPWSSPVNYCVKYARGRKPLSGSVDSKAAPKLRISCSPHGRPMSCMPTGRSSSNPHGTESAGSPARFAGPTSRMRLSKVSTVLPLILDVVSPTPGTRIGMVGATKASTWPKT